MNGKTKRRIWRWFKVLSIIYISGGIILFFIQDLLLFHPTPLAKMHQFIFNQPFEEVNIPIGKNNLSIVKFKTDSLRKGIVLFYHGNMHNVEHYNSYPLLFTKNGYDVWMIDYPGFGKTTGKRNETIIDEQALMMYDFAAKEMEGDSIIIYGKSIGAGVASYVAVNRKCKRLILETPYYSVDALARHYFPMYPVILLTKYSFPIYKNLQNVKSPIIFFHGTEDEVIPYKQIVRLQKEKPTIELITIENGKHNNLRSFDLFQKKIDSLLSD
jgi:alpha-beta hydrolase superfamily lysophospholipase